VTETPIASQPAPLSEGTTAVLPRTTVGASEPRTRLNLVPRSVTVGEVARALNVLGVTPRDLISIFQALKQAGALHAELVVQ
jgi:flagellar P-ring protein precursor FlgI